MLILSRRIGESIRIGDEVTITILDIRGKRVRISISAPDDVIVNRKEVYERIQAASGTSNRQKSAGKNPTSTDSVS